MYYVITPSSIDLALHKVYRLLIASILLIMEKKKYSDRSQKKIGKVMEEYKEGTLKSGRSGKKVKSRKQAVAIGISEARKAGGKVPSKKS